MLILSGLSIVVLILSGSLAAIRFWVRAPTKERIQSFVVRAWCQIDDYDSARLVKQPISVASSVADFFCGESIVSWRSMSRISWATVTLTLVCLVPLWVVTGKPFGMDFAVDDFIRSTAELTRKTEEREQRLAESSAESRSNQEWRSNSIPLRIHLFLTQPTNRVLHASLMVLSSIAIVWISSVVCWSFSRKLLKAILTSPDTWSLCANFCFNFAIVFVVSSVCSGVLAFVTSVPVRLLYLLSAYFSFFDKVVTHVGLSAGSLYLSPPWFKIVVLTCMFPTIAVGLLLVAGIILSASRISVHRFISRFILRFAEAGLLEGTGYLLTAFGAAIAVYFAIAHLAES